MTKSILIASVAAIALTAPDMAQGAAVDLKLEQSAAERRSDQRAEKRGERRAERRQERRAQRSEANGGARARPSAEQRRQMRGEARAEQRRDVRQEWRQKERRAEHQTERRVERQREARQQARRAERRDERREQMRAERREQERAKRRAERRLERQLEQRRADQRAERRIERERAERRVERQRTDQASQTARDRRFGQQGERMRNAAMERRADRRKAYLEAQRRLERRALRRDAYREWISDRDRAARYTDQGLFVTIGSRVGPDWYSASVPYRYRDAYRDDRRYYYRYDDDLDYLYRIDRRRDRVRDIIPMSVSYALLGQRIPTYYRSNYVPTGYSGYYYDRPDSYYRQVGPALYRMNPETQLLTAVVALLTGAHFNVGQTMPSGFDVYNVPMAYRDRYYDRDDAWYRYDDGSIYQIDPYSRRVVDEYPLYESRYLVGQSWPTAYPDYNVPYGYQGLYYDTPEYDYRYAGGRIYQVDPKTQVIMALASLVTGQQFAVGQPMPVEYDVYNVPRDYRARFVDRDDRWFRYSDGHVYAVDPQSRLIVDSYAIYT